MWTGVAGNLPREVFLLLINHILGANPFALFQEML